MDCHRIYLVGFMGSGKSTIGRLLADHLGWSFCDLDAEIESAQGASVAEIFDTRGEAEFRRLEREAVQKRVFDVQHGRPMVVALGGGAFVEQANQALLSENGVPIWIDCSFDRVCARLNGTSHRPLARDPGKFEQLYHDRREAYGKADFWIEVKSDDPADIVTAILALPIF